MILVLVGDQDDVGLRELVVVCRGLYTEANGIYLYHRTVVIDFHTGVLDARDRHFLTAFGGKLVHLLGGLAAGK